MKPSELYSHTSIPEKFDALYEDSAYFRAAVQDAQRLANENRKQYRVYWSNGLYITGQVHHYYVGVHMTFINPMPLEKA
jgi:hypothetical protein